MGDIQDSIDKKEREKEDMAPEKGQEPAGKEADRPAGLRFFQFWFHRQTRFGRFNRVVVRWLAIIIILFALGLLAGYQFLYKPAQSSSQELQLQLDQDRSQAATLNSQVTALSTQVAALSQQNASLLPASDRAQLLELASQFQTARLYLEKKDFDSAQKVLLANRTALADAAPVIASQDKSMSQTLQTLLDQSMSVLSSDPQKAAGNLDALIKLLLTLEQGMARIP